MIYGLDSSSPPSEATALKYVSQGWSFYLGYIGGNTPHKWTKDEILHVINAGMQFMPIWVAPFGVPNISTGRAEGSQCLNALRTRGLSKIVALDVENGAVPRDYVIGFVEILNAAGYQVMLYGSQPTVEQLGVAELVDFVWLAYWPEFMNSVPKAPYDFNVWQYAVGAIADMNVARDDMVFAEIA